MVKVKTELVIWTKLNARQQSYLKLIYQLDQETEREEKRGAWAGQRKPAEVWRWLFYGDVALNKASPLKQRLKTAQLVDPGTGSTLQALERRQLIECRGEVPELEIKLTLLGRKVARTGLGETLAKRASKGMLSELTWEALVLAYLSGDEGLKQEWGFRYAGIHFNTWDRLQGHRDGALVEEVYHPEDSSSRSPGANRIHLTHRGLQFYRLQWENYQSVYPVIEAPPPDPSDIDEDVPHRLPVDISVLVRLKRGDRGLRETASEIGISPSTLSRLENGKEIDLSLLELVGTWLEILRPVKKGQ